MKDFANACRCRVLPRVRPPAANARRKRPPQTPAANACGEITYTGCGLTRGKTLHRRGLRHENRRKRLRGNTYPGVAVLHEVI